jgi:hypothetical protein
MEKMTDLKMLDHMSEIPFLVKSKCSVCGYDGMFAEIPISKVEASKP